MRLPVFQFAWGEPFDNKFGLMFPSELEYDSATFIYALPVPILDYNQRPQYNRFRQELFSNSFYFPMDIRGTFSTIEGVVNEPVGPRGNFIIKFGLPKGQLVMFEIDIFATRSFYRLKGMKVSSLNKYVGKYRHPLLEQCIFIPLIPTDISILNSAFLESEIVFVGQTATFGEFQFG